MGMKDWTKFKKECVWLIILSIVSITAGLGMLVAPEKTSHWIIRGVGLIWILEGISYGLDIWKKYLEAKIERKEVFPVTDMVCSNCKTSDMLTLDKTACIRCGTKQTLR